mmetsp:Transcript_19808/g.64709  ORF Transcript_19808/g.64709 Transcript_19808/m.64709 type:complete len:232 (-) Transcript_19808:25-720(-)
MGLVPPAPGGVRRAAREEGRGHPQVRVAGLQARPAAHGARQGGRRDGRLHGAFGRRRAAPRAPRARHHGEGVVERRPGRVHLPAGHQDRGAAPAVLRGAEPGRRAPPRDEPAAFDAQDGARGAQEALLQAHARDGDVRRVQAADPLPARVLPRPPPRRGREAAAVPPAEEGRARRGDAPGLHLHAQDHQVPDLHHAHRPRHGPREQEQHAARSGREAGLALSAAPAAIPTG